MIGRLGIVGRLLAIGIIGFGALLAVLGALLYMVRSQEGALEGRFPLPGQISAVVALFESTPPDRQALLIKALNSGSLSVGVAEGPPAASPGDLELPRLGNLVGGGTLAGRQVVVDIPNAGDGGRPLLKAWRGTAPLRVQVGIAGGRHVVIQTIGEPVRRLLGVSSGIWLAALGLIIATVTLAGLFRATRPLRKLTLSLETFSETASPVPVEPSGPADIRRLIGTVNRMQERVTALVKGRTMLAGAISHDLRTYLTRLRLRVDAMEDAAEREGAEADIDAMSAIVENSLAFAHAAAGAGLDSPLDLAALVRTEAGRHGEQGRPVTATLPQAPMTVRGDTVGLGRVIANLVDNALRYAGEARLSLKAADGFAELLVDDNGAGIPPEEREAVFEPFYRLDRARNLEQGGTGLGLALTRQIVEAHGGRITATAAPGGGTRMTVLLPLAKM